MVVPDPAARPQLGRWSHDLVTGSWSWSPEVRQMWDIGIGPDTDVDVVLAVLHPDDRAAVERGLGARSGAGRPTLSGHTRMRTGHGERIFSFLGDAVGEGDDARIEGWSIDVTDQVRQATGDAVEAATRHRRAIEQVKGALMVTYRVDEVTAFAILRRQSNECNVRLQDLAEHVSRAMSAGTPEPGGVVVPMMEVLHGVAQRLRAARPGTTSPGGRHDGLPGAS